ncbi:uncharacterized protein HPF38p_0001 (plasmid) [Helicobacter pylori]|nr:uncharacterized protein HPF28p_0003 [Helicobacter pylori]BAW54066.1 uncharacterized protein HPF38p_0001 [Helicobacter pylori]
MHTAYIGIITKITTFLYENIVIRLFYIVIRLFFADKNVAFRLFFADKNVAFRMGLQIKM